MNTTMYDRFLKLPLFQGLSRNDLTVILEKVKVEFRSYEPDEWIAQQGDPCSGLIFILDGTVRTCTHDTTFKFSLSEDITGEQLIEPQTMFGLRPYLGASYRAISMTNALFIKKEYILPLLCRYEIFNLNFFNLLCSRAQAMQQKLWNTHIGSTLEKVVNFLVLRCTVPSGPKELSITMEDLANLLDETRINVSRVLNKMQDLGYLSMSRKVFRINDLADLIKEAEKEKMV